MFVLSIAMFMPHAARSDSPASLDKNALAKYVRSYDESVVLEYKALRDLWSCKKCDYCRHGKHMPNGNLEKVPRSQRPDRAGVEIARAVSSLANKHGGFVVIGAHRVDAHTNRHELETTACPTNRYTQEMVHQALREYTAPLVPVQVSSPPGKGPPVYLIEVRASLHLHAWIDSDRTQNLHTRYDKTSVPMDVREVEFVSRTKAIVEQNAEFRSQMLSEIYRLFDCVLDRPSEKPRIDLTFSQILQDDPYGVSTLKPGLRQWPIFPQIRKAVLEMPTKMAVDSTPYDIEHVVEEISTLDKVMNPGPLEGCERRLCAAARLLKLRGESNQAYLGPFEVIEKMTRITGSEKEYVWQEFLAGYASSFEQVYDRLAASGMFPLLDGLTKRLSTSHLANALSLLLPVAYETLAFYGRLREEYGKRALTLSDEDLDGWEFFS